MTKVKLLTLDHLDGRTAAARAVRELRDAITRDLGGDPSSAQERLALHAAITSIFIDDLAARWLSGGPFDPTTWGTLCNIERRAFECLGIRRVPRDATPTLAAQAHLAKKRAEHEAAAS